MVPWKARKHEKRTRRRARRPEVKQHKLLSQRRVVEKSTHLHVVQAPEPAMCPRSRETHRIGCGTSRTKRFSPAISLRFLCVHASSCDCVLFGSHMSAYGMHTRAWAMRELRQVEHPRGRDAGAHC
jgi:hypothetical protein